MILLVTSSERAQEFADALKSGTGKSVQHAIGLEAAAIALRRNEYAAVVIDEAIAQRDSEALSVVLSHAGSAVPIFQQLAISSTRRIVQEVTIALRRCQRERKVALEWARSQLRDELRGKVTGILLSSELALSGESLTRHSEEHLREIYGLAQEMQEQLRI